MEKYMGEGGYPKWGTHLVEIDLQWGAYKGTVRQRVGGNCLGGSVIKSALDYIIDGEYEPQDDESLKHCVADSDGIYAAEFILFDENGDECYVEDDFEDLIVGARIIGWVSEEATQCTT